MTETAGASAPIVPPVDMHVPAVSVVIPCKDEADNLAFLVDEIATALAGRTFEVIVVDDGSNDGTANLLATRRADGRPWLRHIRHAVSCGQSASVRTGMLMARGHIVATIDGDGQNDPAYIPALVDAVEKGSPVVALAAGQRLKRKASFGKKYGSKFANAVRGWLLEDGTRDTGCGLKAVRRDVFLLLPYFDSWHRFLPALVLREGYQIAHVDVVDRERRHGSSKYGIWDRFWIGVLDLFGVWWLRRRRKNIPQVKELTVDVG